MPFACCWRRRAAAILVWRLEWCGWGGDGGKHFSIATHLSIRCCGSLRSFRLKKFSVENLIDIGPYSQFSTKINHNNNNNHDNNNNNNHSKQQQRTDSVELSSESVCAAYYKSNGKYLREKSVVVVGFVTDRIGNASFSLLPFSSGTLRTEHFVSLFRLLVLYIEQNPFFRIGRWKMVLSASAHSQSVGRSPKQTTHLNWVYLV